MLIAIHHAVIYYRVSKDRALRASQLEARLAQSQLQMLRMQLQPHFLFNTLHSISALMHKDVKRADSMIAALSDLLRMSLQNIGAQEVALQSELDFLQRYVEIMSLRFGSRLQVEIDVDPDTRDARVPNLFLQPLVENAFRHGFGDHAGPGKIAVTVRRDGDMLLCDVADDGRGLRAGHKEGVGLSSTRQRLAHLYGEHHSFALRGAPGEGVRVTMAIPFHPYERTAAD
jgi:LytS/YehU family sensor histidine kinase